MRKKNSCIFDPYFKVQTRDPLTLAWKDIQKAHPTAEDAFEAAPTGKLCRIMRVTETGRQPGGTFTKRTDDAAARFEAAR